MSLKKIKLHFQHFLLKNISALKTWRQKCYLSARGMHDRSRWRRRSAGNLLINPETQWCPLNFCRYEQKIKTEPILLTWIVEVPSDLSAFPPYGWPFVWPLSWKPLPAGMVYIFEWQEQVMCKYIWKNIFSPIPISQEYLMIHKMF